MQRLKILGVALMAVFMLGAFVSATASARVEVLPEGKEETWKGESGKGTLEVLKGNKVTCAKDKSEGTIEATKPLGLFHITFEGCKGPLETVCTGLGDKNAGEVLVLGTYHFVFDKLGAKLSEAGVGVLFLLELLHFTCGEGIFAVLILVKGEVLCLIKPVNTLAKHFEIVCEQKEGDPKETVYWNEEGKEVKMGEEGLLTAENDKTFVMSGELTTALILTPNNIEIMT